jgi:hypothetical protein
MEGAGAAGSFLGLHDVNKMPENKNNTAMLGNAWPTDKITLFISLVFG